MANNRDIVHLQFCKLDINNIIESVVSPNCGAISSFIGTTRDNFEQKKVVKLEYEAYETMALKEMQTICDKIRSKWNIEKIAIFHRLGEVPVTQASIVIAISSPHRQESLLAVQFAIDAVKTSVPIWKKEIYENADPTQKFETTCISNEKKVFTIVNNELTIFNEENVDLDNICNTVEVEVPSINENDAANKFVIDPEQVQIKADAKELNRRIESFISRKREQVNALNLHEFCINRTPIQNEDDEATCVCARVNAVFMRGYDSKNRLKVHRVYNQWSHQNIKPVIPVKLENKSGNYPSALEERLSTTEKILGVNKPVPRDIYQRIKKIEDRLLFLEGLSPEYRDLWSIDDCESVTSFDGNSSDNYDRVDFKPAKKRAHSSINIGPKVHGLEDRYATRK
ncbi:molybdopterin synthase catalytic subunit isoform X2 [Phymastichus coffea]|uniref:molybdopterin synthase catalytic subunit isoform X2 n=1 Tax=Phymastichus coffea TaxID=108790 RepID=UPI00273C2531|nr:molybdopterin synthase catalytic subunit isoform X2 [Phymastichus coffea]